MEVVFSLLPLAISVVQMGSTTLVVPWISHAESLVTQALVASVLKIGHLIL